LHAGLWPERFYAGTRQDGNRSVTSSLLSGKFHSVENLNHQISR
jgi:hypothetical protein